MKNQNSSFTDTKFKNSNNASRVQNANKSIHNQNHSECENVIKNSKQVNIAHMDAKVLVYVWLISFISTLFLAICGYIILDHKIEQQSNNFNAFVVGLTQNTQNLPK